MKHAFTLIELLIVVTILLILAAIGMVNYLSAQARAKVARVHADMRTLAVALEQYHLDWLRYPPAADGDVLLDHPLDSLTSPMAYLGALPRDPFGASPMNFNPGILLAGYLYIDRNTTSINLPAETYGQIWRALPEKRYYLHSAGPNRVWDVMPFIEYDPTNGTTSVGDILRFGPM